MGRTIHSAEYQALLAILREARTKSGLSQTQLAAQLGRAQTWVSKAEIGERRLDIEDLRLICKALDVDLVTVVRRWLKTIS